MLSDNKSINEIIFDTVICTFHIIIMGEQIAHLSFTKEDHLRARKIIEASRNNNITTLKPSTSIPVCKELTEFLAGRRHRFTLTASPFFLSRGTPLQQRIWRLIAAIPYGHTKTYGDIGRALGNPFLARAVGQAAKANPVALLIPCHRVTGAHDAGGFTGGTAIKKHLLRLEMENRRELPCNAPRIT